MTNNFQIKVTWKKDTTKDQMEKATPWIKGVLSDLNKDANDDFPNEIQAVYIDRVTEEENG